MKFEIIKYDNVPTQFWLWLMGWASILNGLIVILTLGKVHTNILLLIAIKVSRVRYKFSQSRSI